jgi:hypothetical protein
MRSLQLFIVFYIIFLSNNFSFSKNQRFSLLRDFTCAVAKDELQIHPDVQTIAMIELENNFPPQFRGEILKCLPDGVAKVNIVPHTYLNPRSKFKLSKHSMVIYIADKIEKVQNIF